MHDDGLANRSALRYNQRQCASKGMRALCAKMTSGVTCKMEPPVEPPVMNSLSAV